MNILSRLFFKGMAILAPTVGTIAIVVWFGSMIESLISRMLNPILPNIWSFPGLGILIGIATVICVGLLAHLWFFKKLFEYLGQMLAKAPLVKAIYGSLKDLSGFIFPADAAHRRLVLTAGVVGSKDESDSD